MYRNFLQKMLGDLLFRMSAAGKSILGDKVNWDIKRPSAIERCSI